MLSGMAEQDLCIKSKSLKYVVVGWSHQKLKGLEMYYFMFYVIDIVETSSEHFTFCKSDQY